MLFEYCNVLACIRLKEAFDTERTVTRLVYDYEMDLHLGGGRRVCIDGVPYDIAENTCVIRKPGQRITGTGSAFDAYCLTVSFWDAGTRVFESRKKENPMGKTIENPLLDTLPTVFPVKNIGPVTELYELLSHICLCKGDRLQRQRVFEKLLLLLASEAMDIRAIETPQRTGTAAVKNTILTNFAEEFSLDAMAKQVGFSKEHLIRMFKKECNCTPVEFLIRVRMENARNMLLNSGLSIQEIAASCGYSNLPFFSATFKKKYRMSPSQYRRFCGAGTHAEE